MKKSIRNILAGTASVVAAAAIITGGTIFSSAIKAEKNSIGAEAAVSAAFKDAGLKKEDALRTESEFDRKNGKYVFDVEFDANGKEYDYVIDAKSGAVIERKAEKDNDAKKPEKTSAAEIKSKAEAKTEKTSQPAKSEKIDLDAAKEKAVKDAGFEINSVKFIKAKLDRDDGKAVYEIEFTADGKEYEYDINASTGSIIDKDVEAVKSKPQTVKESKTSAAAEQKSDFIGVDGAKQKSLSHAGLNSSDVRFTKVKLDRDDGISVYEIEFISGNYEYEYEINAKTGKIIDWDKETD